MPHYRFITLLLCLVLAHVAVGQSNFDDGAPRYWIKLRLTAGAAGNESYTDIPYKDPDPSHFSYESNMPIGPITKRVGYTVGLNMILGPHEYMKHVVGIGFINSYTEYLHEKSDWGYSSTSSSSNTTKLSYQQQTNYLTVHYHLGAYFNTHFSFETGLMLVGSLKSSRYKTGYIHNYKSKEVFNPSTNSYDKTVDDEMQTFDHNKEHVNPGTFSVLGTVRINYDFLHEYGMGIPLGIYIEGSIGITRRIGWVSAGINFYPFKALR